jgi:hypothetical protein
MARSKPIDRRPKLLPVACSCQILPGSVAYARCQLSAHERELSQVDPRCRNDEGGAPADAPALWLKIVLLAYSHGLVSSRARESACRHHVLLMAVCGPTALLLRPLSVPGARLWVVSGPRYCSAIPGCAKMPEKWGWERRSFCALLA